MSDVGFDGRDRAEVAALRTSPKGTRQSIDLQRIADDRSGSMAFDIADIVG